MPAGSRERSARAVDAAIVLAAFGRRARPGAVVIAVLLHLLAVGVSRVPSRRRTARPARESRELTGHDPLGLGGPRLSGIDSPLIVGPEELDHHPTDRGRRHLALAGDTEWCRACASQFQVLLRRDPERLSRSCACVESVEDVKEDVLGEMALRQQAHRPIAEHRHVGGVGNRSPGRDEMVGEPLGVNAARHRKLGHRVMVVIEVGLELSPLEAQRDFEHLLIERNPVAIDPLFSRQPVVCGARWSQAVVCKRTRGREPERAGEREYGDRVVRPQGLWRGWQPAAESGVGSPKSRLKACPSSGRGARSAYALRRSWVNHVCITTVLPSQCECQGGMLPP